MNVDVLIATNRPAEELRPVLRSYTQQDTADFSILLITEKQARGLEDLCQELHITNARVVQIPANTSNAAVSRNKGIAEAEGDIVVFSDDDMVVSPSFITEHVRSHAECPGALVRGVRYQARGDGTFFLPRMEQVALQEWHEAKAYIAWAYWVTSNGSVSLKQLRAVDGFDPAFPWSGCEDTDLAYRLIRAGARPVANRRAINFHLSIDDLQAKFERRIPNFQHFAAKFPKDLYVQQFVRATLQAIRDQKVDEMFAMDSGAPSITV